MFAALQKELKNVGKSDTANTKLLLADGLSMCGEYFKRIVITQ